MLEDTPPEKQPAEKKSTEKSAYQLAMERREQRLAAKKAAPETTTSASVAPSTSPSSVATTTSTEPTSPTAGTTPASTTSAIKPGKAWDNEVAPLIIKHKWEENFTEENNPYVDVLKNVLNGEYEKPDVKLSEDNQKLYSGFKTAANNFKDILIQLDKGVKIDPDKIKDASWEWQTKFFDFKEGIGVPTSGYSGFDDNTNLLVPYSRYILNTTEPVPLFEERGTSITVDYNDAGKKGPRLKPDAAFSKLEEWDNEYMTEIDKNVTPVLNSWVNSSIDKLKTDFNNKANKNTIYNFYEQAFKFIEKNGTGSNSQNADTLASNLLKQINDAKWQIDSTLNIIKENEEEVKNVLGNLGYFSKINIYGENRSGADKVGSSDIYYATNQDLDNNVNAADAMIQNYSEYNLKLKLFRRNSIDNAIKNFNDTDLGSEKSIVFEALFDESGRKRSAEEFLKIIKSRPPIETMETIGNETDEFGRSMGGPPKQTYIKKIPYANWLAQKEASIFNLYAKFGRESSVNNQLIDIYDNALNHYKKNLSNTLPAEFDPKFSTGLYSEGFGEVSSPKLKFMGVDLRIDNQSKALTNLGTKKQENINKLFTIISGGSGNINQDNIVLLNNADIKKGLESFDDDDKEEKKSQNAQKFDEFFNNNQSLNFSEVKFERYSNLPNHSYYEFNSGGRKLGMLVPFDALEKESENMYVKTKENPIDRVFHFTGIYRMPDVVYTNAGNTSIIKDRKITLDVNQNNIIQFTWLGDDGKWNAETINAGHTSGTTIENTKAIMNSITDQMRNKQIKE